MAGANIVLRLIGGTISLVAIAIIGAVGVQLIDPIYANVIDPGQMKALGWGTPQDTVMMFMSLASIGLALVVIVWWVVGSAREDVRQEGPPGGGGPF